MPSLRKKVLNADFKESDNAENFERNYQVFLLAIYWTWEWKTSFFDWYGDKRGKTINWMFAERKATIICAYLSATHWPFRNSSGNWGESFGWLVLYQARKSDNVWQQLTRNWISSSKSSSSSKSWYVDRRGKYYTTLLYNQRFDDCSDVWHHCIARSKDKLEQLNKQALSFRRSI